MASTASRITFGMRSSGTLRRFSRPDVTSAAEQRRLDRRSTARGPAPATSRRLAPWAGAALAAVVALAFATGGAAKTTRDRCARATARRARPVDTRWSAARTRPGLSARGRRGVAEVVEPLDQFGLGQGLAGAQLERAREHARHGAVALAGQPFVEHPRERHVVVARDAASARGPAGRRTTRNRRQPAPPAARRGRRADGWGSGSCRKDTAWTAPQRVSSQ